MHKFFKMKTKYFVGKFTNNDSYLSVYRLNKNSEVHYLINNGKWDESLNDKKRLMEWVERLKWKEVSLQELVLVTSIS